MSYWAKDGSFVYEDSDYKSKIHNPKEKFENMSASEREKYEKERKEREFEERLKLVNQIYDPKEKFVNMSASEREKYEAERTEKYWEERSKTIEEVDNFQIRENARLKFEKENLTPLQTYYTTGTKSDEQEYYNSLMVAMEHPNILIRLLNNIYTDLNNIIKSLETKQFSPKETAEIVFALTKKLDLFTDLLYALKNNNYSFYDIKLDTIETRMLDFSNRIWKLQQNLNIPITMALPIDFTDKTSEDLKNARRGEATTVIPAIFERFKGKAYYDAEYYWKQKEYGKYYDPTNSNWSSILGGISETGEKIEPSKETQELINLFKQTGYRLPTMENGKIIYEELEQKDTYER